jgi:UDP-2,4-diacetamido-2,4,6-trideoxy-beta-L-altropyranose hydrolase
VDASIDIGTGHVMRCATLAQALKQRGAQVRFGVRDQPGSMMDWLASQGFQVCPMPAVDHSAELLPGIPPNPESVWPADGQGADVQETLVLADKHNLDGVIVDHYGLDQHWEKVISSAGKWVMVIDDLANRPHQCDLLLDQNLGRSPEDYDGLVPKGCELLCGPEFALLRPEFAELREKSLERRKDPELTRILVSMGGSDHSNATAQVILALNQSMLPDDTEVRVVMGAAAPWWDNVQTQAKESRLRIVLERQVGNMAALMAWADFAIGAAGSTSWERCCMGLPSAVVVVAENQSEVCFALERAGAVKRFSLDNESGLGLTELINGLLFNDRELHQISSAASQICDGHGTERVVSRLFHAQSGISNHPVGRA